MSIYPFKRKGFALQVLGLKESEYNVINSDTKGAKEKNEKVFLEKERILKSHFESCDQPCQQKSYLLSFFWLYFRL